MGLGSQAMHTPWPMAPMAPRGDAPLEFLNGELGPLAHGSPLLLGGEYSRESKLVAN